jgi:hypothetical protein
VQSGNQIGDVGAKSIAAAVEGNSSLLELHLVRWSFSCRICVSIFLFCGMWWLTRAVQGWNRIGDVGATYVASAVIGNNSLQSLDLVRWSLDLLFLLNLRYFVYHGAWWLTCAVQSGNQIGDVGAKSIAAAVEGNSSLLELHLVRWSFSCRICVSFFLFCGMWWLTRAVQGWNRIGDVGATYVASAVLGSNSLQSLDLVRWSLGFVFLLNLRFCFWYRGAWWLTCAVQSGNQIGDVGAKSIAAAVEGNSSLQILNLVRWSLGLLFLLNLRRYRGAWWLTCAVQSGNRIGDVGAKSIAAAVEGNSSLQSLDLVRWSLGLLFLLNLRFFFSFSWYVMADVCCAGPE